MVLDYTWTSEQEQEFCEWLRNEIKTNNNRSADLSDWIAGDRIQYTAEEGDNSGELIATELKNISFRYNHHGRNGWIKEIRAEEDEMDVEWAGIIYTLNTADAKLVAGLKNPSNLEDFQVDDRIRARVYRQELLACSTTR